MPIEVLAVDGQEVSGQSLRLAGFHATRGGNGVALPADLRVKSLGVPGSAVQVVRGPSGSAALVSRFPSAAAQSYLTVATETETVPVPATDSSGGATRYIIQHINDPQYPGQTAGQPPGEFACVDSLAPFAQIPHTVLARIDQPSATATITQDMIVDLRQVANPREKLERMARPNVASDTGMTLNATAADGEWFPNSGGDQDIPIPSWATKAQITAYWLNIAYEGGVNPYGAMWVEYGPYLRPSTRERSTQLFGFNHFVIPGSSRGQWIVGDTVDIPADYRGTTQKFVMKARYNGADKGVYMDGYSGVVLDVRFVEVADQVD